MGFSLAEWGPLTVVHRLPVPVASLAAEHRLQAHRLQSLQHADSEAAAPGLESTGSVAVVDSGVAAPGLESTGSVAVAHGLSCSVECGIFPDQRWRPCLLHW